MSVKTSPTPPSQSNNQRGRPLKALDPSDPFNLCFRAKNTNNSLIIALVVCKLGDPIQFSGKGAWTISQAPGDISGLILGCVGCVKEKGRN